MKRKPVRFLSIALAASMLATAATGCSSKKPSSSSSSAISSSGSSAADQKVTLKWWHPYDSAAGGVNGIHDDSIMNQIKKDTGVTIDFVFDLTQDKYNACLAAGDLPDIITAHNTDINTLIDGKDVVDMKPYLAQYGKDITAETPEKIQYAEKFMSENQNKLYFLPTWDTDIDQKANKTFADGSGIGFYLRWDLYEKVGMPSLGKTLFDTIPVLKKMQDAYPKTADGKKVYALAPWFGDWDLWNFTIFTQRYLNVDAEHDKFIDIQIKDNGYMKSQINDTSSSLWLGAEYYNKAFQAGIIDPDSFTENYDSYLTKMKAGRILCTPVSWATSNADVTKAGHPEQGFMAAQMPSDVTSENVFSYPYGDRWSHAISRTCKYPEKAMQFINYISSAQGMRLFVNGVKGVDWEVGSDGLPHWTEEAKAFRSGTSASTDTSATNKKGFNLYTQLYGRSDQVWDPVYKCPINFSYNDDLSKQTSTSVLYQNYSKDYGVSYPDQVFEKTLPKSYVNGGFLNLAKTTPSDIKQIDDDMLNYLKSALVQAVMCKTDAAFQAAQAKIIADCKAMGSEKAFEWHEQNYEAARENVANALK